MSENFVITVQGGHGGLVQNLDSGQAGMLVTYALNRRMMNRVFVPNHHGPWSGHLVQSGAAYHSQGFEDKNLGSSPVCLGSR